MRREDRVDRNVARGSEGEVLDGKKGCTEDREDGRPKALGIISTASGTGEEKWIRGVWWE